jgi:hypothetical protein
LSISKLNAQTLPNDTLKKVSVDTLTDENNSEAIEEKITYSAEDSIVALPQLGKVLLYGKSKITYSSINIDAENIEIDYTKNVVLAYGGIDSTSKSFGTPVFKDGEETIEASKIMYNLKSKKGKIFNALTRQGELLVFGSEIKKDSLNNVYFKDMRCLPCQEADARTAFRATKAKAIPNDKIITGPLFLEVGGVPTIIGLPFGYFPNSKKQANGILIPTFNSTEQFGYGLKQGGYYFGINEKTDMIIRGDIYTNGTWAINATNNYNVRYKYTGSTYVNYSRWNNGDKDVPKTYKQTNAYEIRWRHTQDNKNDPTTRFSANVNYVGNQSYNRFNAVNTDQYLQNTFQSNVNYTKSFKLSSLSLNASSNQSTKTGKVDINLPSLTFNVNRFFPFKRETASRQNIFDKFGMSYSLEGTNTLSGIDSSLFKGSTLDSMNYGLKHTLPMSTNFNILKYITASPALNLSVVMYPQTIEKEFYSYIIPTAEGTKDSITAYAIRNNIVNGFKAGYDANFSTAFNTKVYFDYLFRKGNVKQIRHLLIPTLTYNYRPDYGDDKYGFYKTVPIDTLGNPYKYSIFEKEPYKGPAAGKQNAISLGLNNNFESKIKVRSDTGVTYKKIVLLQNLGINGSYNMAADSFKMSNVVVSARTVLFKYFDINASASYDPYDYDNSNNRRTSNYAYDVDGRLLRFVSANIAINTSIGSNMIEEIQKARQSPSLTNEAEQGQKKEPEAGLPWNLRVNYNLILTNSNDRKVQPQQALNFSGAIQPTKFWKIGLTSGFDFTNQKLSYTSLNIYRDLKCWEARIDWVPFGPRKSYNLTINLKASMLSDFRIPKRSIPRVTGF